MAGRPDSQNLFKEFNPEGIYSLQEWHDKFVSIADPTEYEAAIALAGTWVEWNRIKRNWPHFKNVFLASWLDEVDVKLRSDGIKQLIAFSKDEKGTVAAKWLAEGQYKKRKPGKPSKEEVEREAKINAKVQDEVEEELSRVIPYIKVDNGTDRRG